MGKKIWILNHYATNHFKKNGGRHFWIAEQLKKKGYEPVVFGASDIHNENFSIDLGKKIFKTVDTNIEVPLVIVKVRSEAGGGISRILNMIDYYFNVKKAAKQCSKQFGKPDVIYASSVHPLALVAGEQLAKYFGVPCICEVRDLWPFTLVEFGYLKNNSLLTKALYWGEKWIYKKADDLIFTFRDGKQYIIDQGWETQINLNHVHYINNGIDVEKYDACITDNSFEDKDLNNDSFKVIYAGTLGAPNCIDLIMDAAQKSKNNCDDIVFLMYGSGSLKKHYENYCVDNNIDNVRFKGDIEKSNIPYVLSKSDCVVLPIAKKNLYKYGISMNKTFDYLASGKPIITNNDIIQSIVDNEKCVFVNNDLYEGIMSAYQLNPKEYERISIMSREIVKKYDFEMLTCKLIGIIEEMRDNN